MAAVVDHKPRSAPADLPLIEVPDTRKALGKLANHIRRQLKHTKVIAVAGSNGKTFKVIATQKADADEGYHYGVLSLKTTSAYTPEINIPVRGMILKPTAN